MSKPTENIHFSVKLSVEQIRHLDAALSYHYQTYDIDSREDQREVKTMRKILSILKPLCFYGEDLTKVNTRQNQA
jgi:hypothetical protein